MKCPKCNSIQAIPLTQQHTKFYCNKCKYTWGTDSENKEGTLNFEGVASAQMLMDILDKAGMDAPTKLAFATQLVTTIYDQWHEGFKTGLLADFVHKKDLINGKDSIGPNGEDREHSSGTGSTSVSSDQNGETGTPSGRTGSGARRVKENVSGIDVFRPAHITIPEDHYNTLAMAINLMPHNVKISQIETDGISVKMELKLQ